MSTEGGQTAKGDSLAEFGYQQELKRSLRLRDLLIYGLIFMVPIAPFAIFGVVFDASKGMVPLTYVIGLVAMIFTALSYREMSRAFPVAGSVYAYAGRGIAPWVGFLAGWAILLDYLLAGAHIALRHRSGRTGHGGARCAAVAVGGRLRRVQHGGEPGGRRDDRLGEPRVPGGRADRAHHLRGRRDHRDQQGRRRCALVGHAVLQRVGVLTQPGVRGAVRGGAVVPRFRRDLHAGRGGAGRLADRGQGDRAGAADRRRPVHRADVPGVAAGAR